MNLGQFLLLINTPQAAAPSGLTVDSIVSDSSYSVASFTIAIPGTMVVGDTMMVLVNSTSGSSASVYIPAAWDADIYGTSPILGGSNRAYAFLHYITGGDVSSGSVVLTVPSDRTIHVVFIKGHALVDTYSFSGVNENPAPASITGPTLTATGDGDLLFFHASAYHFGLTVAPTFSTPSGYTLLSGPASPTYAYALTAYKTQGAPGIIPAATSTTNYTTTCDTTGSLIALKPA